LKLKTLSREGYASQALLRIKKENVKLLRWRS